MVDELIAITGATGAVGSRVAARLAAKGAHQRLIVKDPARAPDIEGAEIRLASGYIDGGEMRAAMEGAHTLFLIPGRESAIRVAEHITAINAAVAADIERIVYLSFAPAADDAVCTLARDHYATEQHIRTTGIPFTFLRMNLYLDQIVRVFVSPAGVIQGPADGGRVAAVLRDDVADACSAVLTGDGHDGATYDLTGREAFTLAEAAVEMSRASGKAISFHDETVDEAYASRAMYNAPDWEVAGWVTSYSGIAAGEFATISDDVKRLAGHEPLTLAEYLAADPHAIDHVTSG
ncbi:MAG TPA: SDR family oxidoreductase [Candidatus Dormibacteraeota bacterium]